MSDGAAELYDVVRLVRPLHQYSAKVVSDQLAGERVTMAMRAVLERLRDGGPQAVPQIARSLWLDRQPVQRVVDAAGDLGLVELRENPAHRRSPLVALTEAGDAAFAAIHEVELRSLAEVSERLDRKDIEAAVRVVQALADHLRELSAGPAHGHGASAGDRPSPAHDDERSRT